MVRMAADHLRRVLIAILDNASKYTPEGGEIRIVFGGTNDLRLSVTDTGPGIAAEHLDHIFDRFFRVDQARTNMKEGVGLGLSIAKRLMELYGGSISVESELRIGTSVVLVFPPMLLDAE